MQIDPGIFNKKIQIISYLITKDSSGFKIKTENIVLQTWAEVKNTSGTQIIANDSDFEKVKTRFLIRTPKIQIDKDMIIKFDNKIFEIDYVNDYSYDKNYTEILTTLVVK